MPYVIFVQGSDFHEGSSIIDRLSMLAPFNVFKIESTLPSVFVNINKNWKNDPILWTAEQMFNISYAACQESLRCILKNK